MLHAASCSHLDHVKELENRLVETPKLCSTDSSDLQQYAESHDQTLVECRQCEPLR